MHTQTVGERGAIADRLAGMAAGFAEFAEFADFAEGRLLVEHVERADSTNSELLRRDPLLPAGSRASALWLVAKAQTAGRGRRLRTWSSTPAASLTASFAREATLNSPVGALSLVAGIAVAQSLERFGVQVRLKWPNDIHVAAGKAGGILCEARWRRDTMRLVIGCGLNLLSPPAGIDQPAAGLFAVDALPDRLALAEAIGCALLRATDRLLVEGFAPFRAQWSHWDMLSGCEITVHDGEESTTAVACGIDEDGALLVKVPGAGPDAGAGGRTRRLLAEEVSVRPLQVESRSRGS